jgi:dCMP deaminase
MRPTWDEYFIEIVDATSKRATCDRGKCACVIVSPEHEILATGYVGSVRGMPHCDDVGHQLDRIVRNGVESEHCKRTIHAEMNAVCSAARGGVSVVGATVYTTMSPCYDCAKVLANCGVVRVVSKKRYHRDQETRDLFESMGVEFQVLKDEVQEYPDD